MEAEANHSTRSIMLGAHTSAKFGAWLDRTQLFAKLKFTNTFVIADWVGHIPPNLNPTKFSCYTILYFLAIRCISSIAHIIWPLTSLSACLLASLGLQPFRVSWRYNSQAFKAVSSILRPSECSNVQHKRLHSIERLAIPLKYAHRPQTYMHTWM